MNCKDLSRGSTPICPRNALLPCSLTVSLIGNEDTDTILQACRWLYSEACFCEVVRLCGDRVVPSAVAAAVHEFEQFGQKKWVQGSNKRLGCMGVQTMHNSVDLDDRPR